METKVIPFIRCIGCRHEYAILLKACPYCGLPNLTKPVYFVASI